MGPFAGPGVVQRLTSGEAQVPDSLLGGLPPVLATRTRILLLGSFPGVASLAQARYYAHPRNQFWRLLGACLKQPLAQLDYPQRLQVLHEHGVGLWDVVERCRRQGSLDAAIQQAAVNPLVDYLRRAAPGVERIGFNGALAWKLGKHLEDEGYRVFKLPSSSPAAAAVSFEDKLEIWKQVFLD